MPQVEFRPSGKVVAVSPKTELLEAARQAGIELASDCGGAGTCGKCLVRIVQGEVDSRSLGALPQATVADGYVLACATRILKQDVILEVPQGEMLQGGKFASENETHLIRRELLPKQWELAPLALKWRVQVAPPQPADGLSDLDRLTRAVQEEWGKQPVEYSLFDLRKLAQTLRSAQGGAIR